MTKRELAEIEKLDPKYKPLSAWAYFGYAILFSIPLIGFIALVCCSLSNSNINRRSFARSYFCIHIIVFVLILVAIATGIGSLIWAMIKGGIVV